MTIETRFNVGDKAIHITQPVVVLKIEATADAKGVVICCLVCDPVHPDGVARVGEDELQPQEPDGDQFWTDHAIVSG